METKNTQNENINETDDFCESDHHDLNLNVEPRGNQTKLENGHNKKIFDEIDNMGKTFEDESNEYAGDDILLTFTIKGGNESINGQSFQEKFKGGQDFEFVKYRVGTLLDVDPESIELYLNENKIIPIFSISDIEIGEDQIITIEISAQTIYTRHIETFTRK